MKFVFDRRTSRFSGLTQVELTMINGSMDKVGTLHLDIGEWEMLRAILLEGAKLFMDGEVEVEINDHSYQPAYLEGAE